MEEQIIGFEVAKLAKDKGFDWPCKYAYDINKKLFHDSHCNTNWNDKVFLISECSAPTQALLQKWLREKHNIHIAIKTEYDGTFIITIYNMNKPQKANQNFYEYSAYEEALEAGLFAALQLIKNEN